MSQFVQLRDSAERCRRLARDSLDDGLRDGLLKLADEYIARAVALAGGENRVQDG